MHFAFGLSEYTDNQEPVDDPDYGRVIARHGSWALGEESYGVHDDIPLKRCSDEDLGIPDASGNRGDTKFFPIDEHSVDSVKFFKKKFWCVDFEKMQDWKINGLTIQGDFEQDIGRLLKFQFEICDPEVRSSCRSKAEISDWLRGKYLVVLANKQHFQKKVEQVND